MDLDYARRKRMYDADCDLLRIQREQFYSVNPDHPFKFMFMQVAAPPQKVEINFI